MTASFVPVDQLEDGHALILGTTGSGKTYQLRGMLEQLRRAGRRVGAVDKLGNHWGLTIGADGSSPGLDFVIFGGKRAQVPMSPDQGAEIAHLFIARNIPAIFDLSQWPADDQAEWLATFAETVFRENEGALHLSIDEAQSFVPTGGAGASDAARDAYRAVRLLAEQGRGNGLRLLLSCQRLARLDSTVREMMHTVIAMRQTGTIDRKAVRELISADRPQAELIERELPRLPVGTGYLWSAGEVDLRRIEFAPNITFDSSHTPRHGDAPPPPVNVSGALVEELRAALQPPEADDYPDDTIPDDPEAAFEKGRVVGTALRERERDDRIAELEAELAGLRHDRETLDRLSGQVLEIGGRIGRDIAALLDLVDDERDRPALPAAAAPPEPLAPRNPKRPAAAAADGQPSRLNATARDAAALLLGQCYEGFAWNDILLQLGRRPNSGDSRAAFKALSEHGLVVLIGHLTWPTDQLLARVEEFGFGHWRSPAELLEIWADKLRGPGGDMLRELYANGPGTNAELGRRLGKSPTSGWWRQGRKDLLNSRAAAETGGVIHLHPFLQEKA